jgi:ADP-heptose:LPS heptosyltransferase
VDRFAHILVIKSGALGDLIAGTTALRALREAFPSSRITLLTGRLMDDVAPPGIFHDDAIYADEGAPAWKGFLAAVGEVRRRKVDLAVNLRWSSEGSAYLTLLSGAKSRAGSGPRGSRWIYNLRAPVVHGRRHEFLRHLDIARACGAPASVPEPYVHVADADRRFAANALSGIAGNAPPPIAFHPGASTASKAWPAENFVELGRLFARTFETPVLITWGPGENSLAAKVAAGIGPRAHLAPATTVGGLAALIASCAMCVCNYSGVMNVAMAVKTPLLALGCTSPDDWGPYGDLHRTVNAFRGDDAYTETERGAAMRSITVESVWNALQSRWRELALHRPAVTA